jgi:LEA14-like dessication related protein
MTPRTKKLLAFTGALVLGTTVFFIVRQYRKLMQYRIGVKGFKIRQLSASNVLFDLYLTFNNDSDIGFTIKNQQYEVYMNGKYISKISNTKYVNVNPKATNIIPVAVTLNPTQISRAVGKNWVGLLLQPQQVTISIKMTLNVSLWGVGIPIKNTYTTTLDKIMNSK